MEKTKRNRINHFKQNLIYSHGLNCNIGIKALIPLESSEWLYHYCYWNQ